jgi:tRNA pseudouridine32 synthase/23S rRNA pseudouridine746 synthase
VDYHMSQLGVMLRNQHFVVVDKPPLWLSVPSRMGKADPRPVAGIAVQDLVKQTVLPVHRLDEPVSGLLMFALTPAAQRAANQWFENHTVEKTYSALTLCPVPAQRFPGVWQTWTCKLAKGKKRAFIAPHGKDSITEASYQGLTPDGQHKWHLKPVTGRSHQLRFEMARHEMPIDGDALYGSAHPPRQGEGIDLRCFRLDFSRCGNHHEFGLPVSMTIEEQYSTTLGWAKPCMSPM